MHHVPMGDRNNSLCYEHIVYPSRMFGDLFVLIDLWQIVLYAPFHGLLLQLAFHNQSLNSKP